MSDDDEDLISTGAVAKRLGVHLRTASRWATEGKIKPAVVLPGGQYRFRWSEVLAQLAAEREREPET